MTNLSDTLAALSEAATQGEWSISAYYVGTGPDERCGGMVEVDDFPNGIIDEEPATAKSLSPNLEFIVALVNAYRTGQLVPVPSVERIARAMYEADDPWHTAWPWPNLNPDQAGADKYRDIATAVIAAMKEGRDG